MKANELMIGDWVSYKDKMPCIITAICKDTAVVDNDTSQDWRIDYDKLTPIFLTADILERNFVKNGTNRYVVYGGNSYIKDMTNFFELHINFVDFKLEQQIFYVHKLQHALKLCGIDKEIEL